MRNFRVYVHDFAQDPRLGGYARWMSQPGWVWRTAAVAALVFVVLPVALVMLVVGLAFAMTFGLVFGLLAGANRLGRWVGGIGRGSADDAGRRNVRVIRHDDEPPLR